MIAAGNRLPRRLHSDRLTSLELINSIYDTYGVYMKLTLSQLSEQADVPERTIRFYIQKGLLPRPEGEKRGAFYTTEHLAPLLRIRGWQEAGLSLDAIADLLSARKEAPLSPARAGSIEVRSHLIVADGLELVVAPERARLSPSQLRQLYRSVQAAYAGLVATAAGADAEI